jgi:hypothetical protein
MVTTRIIHYRIYRQELSQKEGSNQYVLTRTKISIKIVVESKRVALNPDSTLSHDYV